MYLAVIVLCLIAAVVVYFCTNPLRHGPWFLVRRFINWFPLGMTYAFLYMGRYNLNVAKNAFGDAMSKEDFGKIFAIGTVVYGLSFLINGPLVDRLGGKAGILIAAIGSAAANAALGLVTYGVLTGTVHLNLFWTFSLLYAVNMYFQSYGAVSIIKVKAYWFHVRERGIFGAIFGTLISVGIYFAFDWGQAISDQAQVHVPQATWLHSVIVTCFALGNTSIDAYWAVFLIPAALLVIWALLDWWLIKDTPEEAGFPAFDTHDASSGQMHIEFTSLELLKRVFTSPLMWLIALAELTSGVFRNGITQWYFIFAKEVKQPGAEFFLEHWGWLLSVFGIFGGFAAGLVSDKLFQSRRGPPVAFLCGIIAVVSVIMSLTLRSNPFLVGCVGVLIVTCAVGITSLMSGTAATDFGGRKATATSSGIVDGFAYLGSGLQSYSLGYITTWNWHWWPLFLTPFAVFGLWIALKIWHELPAATKRYIAEVENKPHPEPAAT